MLTRPTRSILTWEDVKPEGLSSASYSYILAKQYNGSSRITQLGLELSQVEKNLWSQAASCRISVERKMKRDQRSGWVPVLDISLLGKGREVGQLHKGGSYSLSSFLSNSRLLFSSLTEYLKEPRLFNYESPGQDSFIFFDVPQGTQSWSECQRQIVG